MERLTGHNWEILVGDCREGLRTLPDASVQCCVTSPPYFQLRDYGYDGQIGLEETPEAYVAALVDVFREVRRVMRDDGTLWLNLGDSYSGSGPSGASYESESTKRRRESGVDGNFRVSKRLESRGLTYAEKKPIPPPGLKPKDLMGIPWAVAFALRADGWWLRSDIIWCLSGGTWVYARTQKGEMPIMLRDLRRLDPSTVKLWNGHKWTQLLGMNRSKRGGIELELVLRSGERISCTPTHKFPTNRGLLEASAIKAGDKLETCRLPQPEVVRDCAIDEDAAWFAGLYLAEGSRSKDKIQIAGHAKESERWERVQAIAKKFGGSATRTVCGNKMNIRVFGKVLNAIVDELVSGRTAKDKGFAPVVWRYSDKFVEAMLDGYLSGDGHRDGDRWRLGFCRNYNLERDLRTACARLGFSLTLNFATVLYEGRRVPTFRGELRKSVSSHHNNKCRSEVVEIRKARCREVYDVGVADEPHLFALASGVLTHNSKPNPMPESVTDRPTKAHEYLFLLSKSASYFYDAMAISEQLAEASFGRAERKQRLIDEHGVGTLGKQLSDGVESSHAYAGLALARNGKTGYDLENGTRNRRSVWSIPTESYPEAHFATYPLELASTCIKAGTSAKGACPECGAPWKRIVEKDRQPTRPGKNNVSDETGMANRDEQRHVTSSKTIGWQPTCKCGHTETVPCRVLDPFGGSGTTVRAANLLGHYGIMCEANPEYAQMAVRRITKREGVKQPEPLAGQKALF